MRRSVLPQRIKLRTKLTKRCPHPNCRHLLIQPDTKSTRMKIKMVAANYLPALEVGRRRRVVEDTDAASSTLEDMERRRRERRKTRLPLREEDEELSATLRPGEVVRGRIDSLADGSILSGLHLRIPSTILFRYASLSRNRVCRQIIISTSPLSTLRSRHSRTRGRTTRKRTRSMARMDWVQVARKQVKRAVAVSSVELEGAV